MCGVCVCIDVQVFKGDTCKIFISNLLSPGGKQTRRVNKKSFVEDQIIIVVEEETERERERV